MRWKVAAGSGVAGTTDWQGTHKVLYPFERGAVTELTVSEGDKVMLIRDDGEWTEVQSSSGERGLVPTAFIEPIPVSPIRTAPVLPVIAQRPARTAPLAPPVATPPVAAKNMCKAVWAWSASAPGQLEFPEGQWTPPIL